MFLTDYTLVQENVEDPRFGTINLYVDKYSQGMKVFEKCKKYDNMVDFNMADIAFKTRKKVQHKNVMEILFDNIDQNNMKISIYSNYPQNFLDLQIFSPEQKVQLFCDILQAIVQLQEYKIYHGDIRLKYMFFDKEIQKYVLLDRLCDESSAVQCQNKNIDNFKNLYMSPIMFNNLVKGVFDFECDNYKSDIFSLGMTILDAFVDSKILQDLYSFEFDKFQLEELRKINQDLIEKSPFEEVVELLDYLQKFIFVEESKQLSAQECLAELAKSEKLNKYINQDAETQIIINDVDQQQNTQDSNFQFYNPLEFLHENDEQRYLQFENEVEPQRSLTMSDVQSQQMVVGKNLKISEKTNNFMIMTTNENDLLLDKSEEVEFDSNRNSLMNSKLNSLQHLDEQINMKKVNLNELESNQDLQTLTEINNQLEQKNKDQDVVNNEQIELDKNQQDTQNIEQQDDIENEVQSISCHEEEQDEINEEQHQKQFVKQDTDQENFDEGLNDLNDEIKKLGESFAFETEEDIQEQINDPQEDYLQQNFIKKQDKQLEEKQQSAEDLQIDIKQLENTENILSQNQQANQNQNDIDSKQKLQFQKLEIDQLSQIQKGLNINIQMIEEHSLQSFVEYAKFEDTIKYFDVPQQIDQINIENLGLNLPKQIKKQKDTKLEDYFQSIGIEIEKKEQNDNLDNFLRQTIEQENLILKDIQQPQKDVTNIDKQSLKTFLTKKTRQSHKYIENDKQMSKSVKRISKNFDYQQKNRVQDAESKQISNTFKFVRKSAKRRELQKQQQELQEKYNKIDKQQIQRKNSIIKRLEINCNPSFPLFQDFNLETNQRLIFMDDQNIDELQTESVDMLSPIKYDINKILNDVKILKNNDQEEQEEYEELFSHKDSQRNSVIKKVKNSCQFRDYDFRNSFHSNISEKDHSILLDSQSLYEQNPTQGMGFSNRNIPPKKKYNNFSSNISQKNYTGDKNDEESPFYQYHYDNNDFRSNRSVQKPNYQSNQHYKINKQSQILQPPQNNLQQGNMIYNQMQQKVDRYSVQSTQWVNNKFDTISVSEKIIQQPQDYMITPQTQSFKKRQQKGYYFSKTKKQFNQFEYILIRKFANRYPARAILQSTIFSPIFIQFQFKNGKNYTSLKTMSFAILQHSFYQISVFNSCSKLLKLFQSCFFIISFTITSSFKQDQSENGIAKLFQYVKKLVFHNKQRLVNFLFKGFFTGINLPQSLPFCIFPQNRSLEQNSAQFKGK